jgi:hypothetical protein
MAHENNIEVPTPWGGKLTASGPLTILVILLLASHLSLGYLVLTENASRQAEHKAQMEWLVHLQCRIELDLWVHGLKEGTVITFQAVPRYLRECMPAFWRDEESGVQRSR